MILPEKLTDPWPIKVVHDPSDGKSMTYSIGGYLALPMLMAGSIAATLWTLTALVYWFVFMHGVIF